ncbi:hypothetical protein [uncultured Polaribacter sp.]|uniref:hypothetical protein n=1 Tax=uncultured Polaribacter sp. TaxID=174711 RepID=UPI002632A0E4|nr:hypothetical protein [uncultured Polaribacter sp.]
MIFVSTIAQEDVDTLRIKSNPVFFAGMNLGFVNGNLTGLNASFDLNYQSNNNLLTFKYNAILDIEEFGFLYFIPTADINSETEEFSILFGKRYIEDGFSYHFSGGISYSITEGQQADLTYSYTGFPLEIGISWFKSKKERFRILYGLIPVGKPTAFGRSIGFKLYGNVSKKSYIGIGLNFGLGWHKKY